EFKEHANTKEAIRIAEESAAKQSLSSHQLKETKASAVVTALKNTADDEQQRVLDYLEREEKKGNAKDIKSYFIVNGIAVTATKEIAEKLAGFAEIEKVLPNETRQLDTNQMVRITEERETVSDIEWNVNRVGAPLVWE